MPHAEGDLHPHLGNMRGDVGASISPPPLTFTDRSAVNAILQSPARPFTPPKTQAPCPPTCPPHFLPTGSEDAAGDGSLHYRVWHFAPPRHCRAAPSPPFLPQLPLFIYLRGVRPPLHRRQRGALCAPLQARSFVAPLLPGGRRAAQCPQQRASARSVWWIYLPRPVLVAASQGGRYGGHGSHVSFPPLSHLA